MHVFKYIHNKQLHYRVRRYNGLSTFDVNVYDSCVLNVVQIRMLLVVETGQILQTSFILHHRESDPLTHNAIPHNREKRLSAYVV